MKEQLIITISDIHGSTQYTVHEVIKKIILWIIMGIFLIVVGTYIYISMIQNNVTHLNGKVSEIEKKSQELTQRNNDLINNNKILIDAITDRSEKLVSMDDKLKEIEEMVGVGPDINSSFFDRIDDAKSHQAHKIEQAKLSALQVAFLTKGIPSGHFLDYRRVSSKFGYRIHPVTKRKDFHAGIDLSAKHGTPIYAPADGVVEYAQKKGAYGNFLLIAHNYGFKTAYGHLSKYAVRHGEYVSKGDLIAYIGSTGRSTGPHLHFELRYLNKWLNPYTFMRWNTKDADIIREKEKKVNWQGIFKQIQNSIDLVEVI